MIQKIVDELERRLHNIKPAVLTEPTLWACAGGTERLSPWSKTLCCEPGEGACESLKRIFDVDVEDWPAKFLEATHGPGGESAKILTLHSSALLALLCFSHVSEANPLKIDGEEYVRRWFEVRSKVFNPCRPASVDVVLQARSGTLLFLESKFTEYLAADSPFISMSYFEFYKTILPLIPEMPLKMVCPKKKIDHGKVISGIGLTPKSGSKAASGLYMGGIKQCFSHLIGLAKGPANPAEECWCRVGNGKIVFASVIYRLPDARFSAYRDFYTATIGRVTPQMLRLALSGEKIPNVDRISVRPQILTYQDLFGRQRDFRLPQPIRDFYKL